MSDLLIGSIAYNVPWVIPEQIRLFRRHLRDAHELVVFNNSSDETASRAIIRACRTAKTRCVRLEVEGHAHHRALNAAANYLLGQPCEYVGLVDHDVFPTKATKLIPKIRPTGFYGIGQRHAPTSHSYLWPGFWFASRAFLAGKQVDFEGIRHVDKRLEGDTGSGMWPLFDEAEWDSMYRGGHGYGYLRPPDDHGLQSFGYETFDDGTWVHLTNTSGWMQVPEGREELVRELVSGL